MYSDRYIFGQLQVEPSSLRLGGSPALFGDMYKRAQDAKRARALLLKERQTITVLEYHSPSK